MNTIKVLQNITQSAKSPSPLDRRSFLRRSGGAAFAMVPMAGLFSEGLAHAEYTTGNADIDVLNFALNLEYLEAEYYLYATTGQGLAGQDVAVTGKGTAGTTTVKSNPMVPFSNPIVQQYAMEIAADETAHVKLLRKLTGTNVVARPPLDLLNSFNTLATAAGIGSSFDPFASDLNFILGAFIFEDVGVTAYHGALASLTVGSTLTTAAGIMGTEAYHASELRTLLYGMNSADPSLEIARTVQKISELRSRLSGQSDDQGIIGSDNSSNIVPTDPNATVYFRTTRQVLNVVYGATNASEGLFFPQGVN